MSNATDLTTRLDCSCFDAKAEEAALLHLIGIPLKKRCRAVGALPPKVHCKQVSVVTKERFAIVKTVVLPVTSEYDVPLMIAKGYPSLSFLHEAASEIAEQGRPCFVYQFGDHDPSGVDAARATEYGLRELAPGAEIHFERVAVTPEQIAELRLPSRPTKTTDSRSRNWTGGDSVELDAIRPGDLRDLGLVRRIIEDHIDQDRLDVLKVAEKSERDMYRKPRWAPARPWWRERRSASTRSALPRRALSRNHDQPGSW
jgi:hypothetical protein